MDILNEKLGPCPRCFDHIKPCRCEMVLKSDLHKLVEAAKMAIEWIEDDRFDDDYISEDWYHEMKAALKLLEGVNDG